jgi:S1-C subfamily serine protease
VKYTEYDVSRDRAAAEEMVRATGQMGVPVIIVDGQVVIGFDRERLKALVSGGDGHRPRFGLKIADAGRVAGAIVGAVSPDSLGEKAGLKAGDIITGINSTEVSGATDAERLLAGLRAGNIVSFVFRRGNDTRKSEIVI